MKIKTKTKMEIKIHQTQNNPIQEPQCRRNFKYYLLYHICLPLVPSVAQELSTKTKSQRYSGESIKPHRPFPVFENVVCFLEHQMMDKVQKPSNPDTMLLFYVLWKTAFKHNTFFDLYHTSLQDTILHGTPTHKFVHPPCCYY
jgi:hypothetical protein